MRLKSINKNILYKYQEASVLNKLINKNIEEQMMKSYILSKIEARIVQHHHIINSIKL